MAKLTDDDVKSIIGKELKGYRIASSSNSMGGASDAGRGRSDVDATTPDLATLRRKYLGDSAAEEAEEVPNGYLDSLDGAPDEDMIVAVEPETAVDPWSRSARPKAKVISGAKKTIIGSQG